jgi:hypothetical protein
LEDILNIPGNELDAFNQFGVSLMDGGTWLVASATNLWGEDPADPGRFMALTQMAIPFPEISGQGSPEPGFGDSAGLTRHPAPAHRHRPEHLDFPNLHRPDAVPIDQ